jgi:hypothetical protein
MRRVSRTLITISPSPPVAALARTYFPLASPPPNNGGASRIAFAFIGLAPCRSGFRVFSQQHPFLRQVSSYVDPMNFVHALAATARRRLARRVPAGRVVLRLTLTLPSRRARPGAAARPGNTISCSHFTTTAPPPRRRQAEGTMSRRHGPHQPRGLQIALPGVARPTRRGPTRQTRSQRSPESACPRPRARLRSPVAGGRWADTQCTRGSWPPNLLPGKPPAASISLPTFPPRTPVK